MTGIIGVQHRIAAEDVVFQNFGKGPRRAAINSITPAALPEVRVNRVKLPPTDCYLIAVRWVNGNRRLVCGVGEDVLTICIDIHLKAGE